MRRTLVYAAILAISLSSLATAPAGAAVCKDAKGKFMKCAPVKPEPAKRCRDTHGKFMKCVK
jgi:hypothetical protein